MTTALEIIKRSMRLNGVYNIGEEPSADESADMLSALNAMLDSMATESLLVYAQTLDAIPLTAGLASVTVGPTGTFVTTRPVSVLDASSITYGSTVYPLSVVTLQDYNDISTPSTSGIPQAIHCLMDMPDITVTPWPLPSAAMTLNLWSNKQIRSFTSLTTAVALPPGYDRLLANCLAVETAPEFGIDAPASVHRIAAAARRTLKRGNVQVPSLEMPYGVPSRREWSIL